MKRGISLTDEVPIPKQTAKIAFIAVFAVLSAVHINPHLVESYSPQQPQPRQHTVRIADDSTRTITLHVAEGTTLTEEELWFARALYSETKFADEQRLVAWVIRNRVESVYFPNTYKAVILQPKQFSGFNKNDPQYAINTTVNLGATYPGWESAVRIAKEVLAAERYERPIERNVMHFYSPRAVRYTPKWAAGREPAHRSYHPTNGHIRFAFYANIVGNS